MNIHLYNLITALILWVAMFILIVESPRWNFELILPNILVILLAGVIAYMLQVRWRIFTYLQKNKNPNNNEEDKTIPPSATS